jgi:cytochrome c
MSELGFNKIAAAVLATGLVVLGLRELSEAIYKPEVAAKPGYALQVAEETSGATPAAELPPDWGTVLPTADIAAGQAQSQKCVSCHTFAKGGANGTGPANWGVVGRQPGAHPGFAFSDATVEYGKTHPAWTYDELNDFLKAPGAYISGTKMTFVGLKKTEDRINLIAWLRQQSDNPSPIPAPKPAPAPAASDAAPAASDAHAATE